MFQQRNNDFTNQNIQKKRERGELTSSMPGKWLIDRKEFDHFHRQLIVSQ